jgi:hypothetical protein
MERTGKDGEIVLGINYAKNVAIHDFIPKSS